MEHGDDVSGPELYHRGNQRRANSMKIELKPVWTRFRAYQLGEPGSSFSYFADEHFTLIEAKLTERSYASLAAELKACGKTTIDTLHITSWDQDHCNLKELQEILSTLQPRKIEYPGYAHDSENHKNCLREILRYRDARRKAALSMIARRIDPPYVKNLEEAKDLGYNDIIFHPKEEFPGSNDNSTVKLYRAGCST
jgi:competence protein ComEC